MAGHKQAKQSASLLAALASTRLSAAPAVQAIVCFASNTFQPRQLPVDGVMVCNASELTALILGQSAALSADDCERIVKMMEQQNA